MAFSARDGPMSHFSQGDRPLFEPPSSVAASLPPTFRAHSIEATPAFTPPPEGKQVHFASPSPFAGAGYTVPQEDSNDEPIEGDAFDRILVLAAARNRVAFFAYDDDSERISFLPDIDDSPDWSLVSQVIAELQPTHVITNSSTGEDLLKALEDALENLPGRDGNEDSQTATSTAANLELRHAREFQASAGQEALLSLRFIEDQPDARPHDPVQGALNDKERRDRVVQLQSYLSSLNEAPLALACAAVLLLHIRAKEPDRNLFRSLQLMSLNKVMLLNNDCLSSLQIFSQEAHANMFSTKTKEGLSLFGIMNVARSAVGKTLMRDWFRRPTLDIEQILARQQAVSCFLRPDNLHVARDLQSLLSAVKNVSAALKALSSGRGLQRDWKVVAEFFFTSVMLRNRANGLSGHADISIVSTLLSAFDPAAFQELGEIINDIIDWDESKIAGGKTVVKPGVDEQLDEWRHTLDGIDDLLSVVVDVIVAETPESMTSSLTVTYFPQMGYLVVLDFDREPPEPGAFGLEDWAFQYHTEGKAYYKNDKCRDLDASIGDIVSFISDKEIEIIQSLLERVLEFKTDILNTVDAIAELDVLLAFAEAAHAYNWSCPNLTEEPVTKIESGRHPLVELCVDTFVPNDFCLVGGHGVGFRQPDAASDDDGQYLDPDDSMLVLSGSNFSGKSVLLKQVALIVFLAHIGSFVPAQQALIGLTDRILTRVSTKESISSGCSAFQIDLNQISFALRNATERSLLVIDEFGKGADPEDGAALFGAVLEHILQRGEQCPRTIVATHFQDIFFNNVLKPDLPISRAHMQVVLPDALDGKTSANDMTYLYQMRAGTTTSSHATACAARFGIPQSVVERADQVSHLVASHSLDALLAEPLTKAEKAEADEDEHAIEGLVQLCDRLDEMGPIDALELECLQDVLRTILEKGRDV